MLATKRWLTTIIILILCAILIYIGLKAFASLFRGDKSIPCLEEYSLSMSPGEISKFFDLPLVLLENVPEGVIEEPQVWADVTYPLESPVCGISISYMNINNHPIPVVRIEVYKSRSSAPVDPNSEWLCIDFDGDAPSTEERERSGCSNKMQSELDDLFVGVFTQYEIDETLSLIENNLKIVYPDQ